MTQTRLLIRRTRSVRDLYLGKRYVAVAISPGGREIVIAKTSTRRRAFTATVTQAQTQTSPTAVAYGGDAGLGGGGNGNFTIGGSFTTEDWDRYIMQR